MKDVKTWLGWDTIKQVSKGLAGAWNHETIEFIYIYIYNHFPLGFSRALQFWNSKHWGSSFFLLHCQGWSSAGCCPGRPLYGEVNPRPGMVVWWFRFKKNSFFDHGAHVVYTCGKFECLKRADYYLSHLNQVHFLTLDTQLSQATSLLFPWQLPIPFLGKKNRPFFSDEQGIHYK